MRKRPSHYNVYHAPEGSSGVFLGTATSLRQARKMAAKHARNPGSGLDASLWDTARVAGHCAGYSAPDTAGELSEPTAWFGRGGWYCAVPVIA